MANRLQALIRRYFGFSYREINGFIILSVILVVLIVTPSLVNILLPSQSPDFSKDKPEFDSLTAILNSLDTIQKPENSYHSAPDAELDKTEEALFVFNPNEITLEQWQQLGVRKYIAERILKYRNKGGQFRKKEDLKKMYGFPESLYAKLEPYISIPQKENKGKDKFVQKRDSAKLEYKKFEKKQAPTTFDLNTADTVQLKSIRGIGTGFANKIIKYRDLLGGFYDASQLKEVYGLPPETVEELLKYAVLQTPAKKIKVNSATQDELYKHPYIRAKAKHIVAYRKQHGNYQSADDLAKIKTLEPEALQKMLPYLEF